MVDKIFDIEFEHEGKKYRGWVNPSTELNPVGMPSSFHVILDDTSFGYLSFNNCNWSVNEERPSSMVKQVGKLIEKHFRL